MHTANNLIVFVDIDDTLVRSFGSRRIPMPEVIRHVRDLHNSGANLYAWSTGGADYAQSSAEEFGIKDCFTAFLPKPNIILDDQPPAEWRRLLHIYPAAPFKTEEEYRSVLSAK